MVPCPVTELQAAHPTKPSPCDTAAIRAQSATISPGTAHDKVPTIRNRSVDAPAFLFIKFTTVHNTVTRSADVFVVVSFCFQHSAAKLCKLKEIKTTQTKPSSRDLVWSRRSATTATSIRQSNFLLFRIVQGSPRRFFLESRPTRIGRSLNELFLPFVGHAMTMEAVAANNATIPRVPYFPER